MSTTFKADAHPQGFVPDVDPPRHVFILSGGIGAGKTAIVNRLKTDFHFVSGSPADIMKWSLACAIAAEYVTDNADDYFKAMLDQETKAEFRFLLQGYGEFFSNRDKYYWADKCVDAAAEEYENIAKAGVQSGIVFDSMRRDSEILAVKKRFPNAQHVRLVIDPERQMDYLTRVLGYDEEKAAATLAHSSEHWLDDMDGTEYDANYVIDANEGDETTWVQFMGIVVLNMTGGELEVAQALVGD